jgi:hypothetical protein
MSAIKGGFYYEKEPQQCHIEGMSGGTLSNADLLTDRVEPINELRHQNQELKKRLIRVEAEAKLERQTLLLQFEEMRARKSHIEEKERFIKHSEANLHELINNMQGSKDRTPRTEYDERATVSPYLYKDVPSVTIQKSDCSNPKYTRQTLEKRTTGVARSAKGNQESDPEGESSTLARHEVKSLFPDVESNKEIAFMSDDVQMLDGAEICATDMENLGSVKKGHQLKFNTNGVTSLVSPTKSFENIRTNRIHLPPTTRRLNSGHVEPTHPIRELQQPSPKFKSGPEASTPKDNKTRPSCDDEQYLSEFKDSVPDFNSVTNPVYSTRSRLIRDPKEPAIEYEAVKISDNGYGDYLKYQGVNSNPKFQRCYSQQSGGNTFTPNSMQRKTVDQMETNTPDLHSFDRAVSKELTSRNHLALSPGGILTSNDTNRTKSSLSPMRPSKPSQQLILNNGYSGRNSNIHVNNQQVFVSTHSRGQSFSGKQLEDQIQQSKSRRTSIDKQAQGCVTVNPGLLNINNINIDFVRKKIGITVASHAASFNNSKISMAPGNASAESIRNNSRTARNTHILCDSTAVSEARIKILDKTANSDKSRNSSPARATIKPKNFGVINEIDIGAVRKTSSSRLRSNNNITVEEGQPNHNCFFQSIPVRKGSGSTVRTIPRKVVSQNDIPNDLAHITVHDTTQYKSQRRVSTKKLSTTENVDRNYELDGKTNQQDNKDSSKRMSLLKKHKMNHIASTQRDNRHNTEDADRSTTFGYKPVNLTMHNKLKEGMTDQSKHPLGFKKLNTPIEYPAHLTHALNYSSIRHKPSQISTLLSGKGSSIKHFKPSHLNKSDKQATQQSVKQKDKSHILQYSPGCEDPTFRAPLSSDRYFN